MAVMGGELQLTVENNTNTFKDTEVIINNFSKQKQSLKNIKAKDFINILSDIIIENDNIYKN